ITDGESEQRAARSPRVDGCGRGLLFWALVPLGRRRPLVRLVHAYRWILDLVLALALVLLEHLASELLVFFRDLAHQTSFIVMVNFIVSPSSSLSTSST